MKLSRYKYKIHQNFLDYEFLSNGPKGNIKKVVRFSRITNTIFNLGFGDLNENTGSINDKVVTNNQDSRKVLATVAAIVNDFTIRYPFAWVAARGSTASRNRLYKIGIVNHFTEISMDFIIMGYRDGVWEPFTKNQNYEAFLLRRR